MLLLRLYLEIVFLLGQMRLPLFDGFYKSCFTLFSIFFYGYVKVWVGGNRSISSLVHFELGAGSGGF